MTEGLAHCLLDPWFLEETGHFISIVFSSSVLFSLKQVKVLCLTWTVLAIRASDHSKHVY